ncbi:MAG: thioredoxin family protein [Burkholderiaceae bacterium]|nr:thioredoxin family protein [Burkholderiaceae bacterium]
MPVLTLNADNHNELAHAIGGERWVVACLCAAWCGTCGSYRATFEELAGRHPDKQFVWIDIEDHADLLGDLDVENFPTLLIQRDETVAFFGTILPDAGVAQRLIIAQAALDAAELAAQAASSAERRDWQQDCNLRSMLRNAAD